MEEAALPKPKDFAFEYQWKEGALPPPDHYEYTIRVGRDAKGTIEFRPDYPRENVPVWTEYFEVDEETFGRIYLLMVDKGILKKKWERDDRIPPGDQTETLDVTSRDNHVLVPANINNQVDIRHVYDTIRKLVPHTIWKRLMAKRDQYENDYLMKE